MLWLYITLASYFLFASTAIFDRYLLAGPLRHPRSYAFYVGATSVLATLLIPFGFSVPSLSVITLSLFAGAVSVFSLWAFYTAIFHGDVSSTVPTVNAFVPLFTLGFLFLFGGEQLEITGRTVIALVLLIAGTFTLAARVELRTLFFARKNIVRALLSASVFGLSFALAKLTYAAQGGFLAPFIWMRWGAFVAALFLLISPKTREVVFRENPIGKKKVYVPALFGAAAGAGASVLQQYAISLARFVEVSFINALAGVQQIFIVLFAVLLAVKRPRILKEELGTSSIFLRFAGVLFIAAGLYVLFS